MTDLSPRLSTGIDGLDSVLDGGLMPNRTYMVRGASGAGKTIVGYHFLSAGVERGEGVLFVSFEESAADLRANAETLGFDLAAVPILDLSPSPEAFLDDEAYTMLSPSEVEGKSTTTELKAAIEERDPDRVVIDPLSQFGRLSSDKYQFRRLVSSLLSYLKQSGTTTMFTSQPSSDDTDETLAYLCDGSLSLLRSEEGRSVRVEKFRGSDSQTGPHAMRIDGDRGIRVFPRLVPGSHHREFAIEPLSSGIDDLDALLGGGIERGSITLISGPSGVGKSTTGAAFARATADRGERAAVYLFEESKASFRHRSESIGIPIDDLVESGTLRVDAVEPLSLSTDEFAHRVRAEVEANGTEFVLIDGTAGYQLSLTDERSDIRRELHALARYLKNMGVTVVLTEEVQQVTGAFYASDNHVSYLADNILFIRYIEVRGEIRKAIGVLKKRFGSFEPTLRSFEIGSDGIVVGEPLDELRGILTGTPTWNEAE
ncbi:recombinase RecA [Haloferax sp. Atlit-19N]|uniref:ATPase domain-containing protein n=1 Tax=Haloferax sp. Atlit-19N TaxID=2077201 RepID=UPI000E22D99A|nr:ATPase domain-containing protein [Haloferax sp. Atlit-19N]RDZ43697.1 recombinase RecA [Haloferax sp. Atlit-19N]